MKIITNTKLINRNKQIGKILTFVRYRHSDLRPGLVYSMGIWNNIMYSYLALIVGFPDLAIRHLFQQQIWPLSPTG